MRTNRGRATMFHIALTPCVTVMQHCFWNLLSASGSWFYLQVTLSVCVLVQGRNCGRFFI